MGNVITGLALFAIGIAVAPEVSMASIVAIFFGGVALGSADYEELGESFDGTNRV